MSAPSRNAYYDDETHRWLIWTRQNCLDALRLACVGAGVPTVKEFNIMHLVEPDVYPSVKTVIDKCGGWATAMRMIGQEPRTRGRASQRDYEPNRAHDLDESGEYCTEWD